MLGLVVILHSWILDPAAKPVGLPSQGIALGAGGLEGMYGAPGSGLGSSVVPGFEREVPVQSFREFKRLMEIEGMRQSADVGYYTPRSGAGAGARVSSDGYPMSPGGTIIRPRAYPAGRISKGATGSCGSCCGISSSPSHGFPYTGAPRFSWRRQRRWVWPG